MGTQNIQGPHSFGLGVVDTDLSGNPSFHPSMVVDGALDSYTTTASLTAVGVVLSLPTTGYMGGSFAVTSIGASNTITFEMSNDNTNWQTMPVQTLTTAGGSPNPSAVTTAIGHFGYVATSTYVRARISAYGSGTVTITSCQKRKLSPLFGVSLASGNSSIGLVQLAKPTTGGLTIFRIVTGASGVIKASAGQVYAYELLNTTAALRFFHLYAKTTAGVPGTDTPVRTIPIPAGAVRDFSVPTGLAIVTGLSWAITTDAAGATIGTSGDVVGSVDYA